jgi:hypothetical protein
MQSIVERPREVVPVNDPKNQGFGWAQTHSLPQSFFREATYTPLVTAQILVDI